MTITGLETTEKQRRLRGREAVFTDTGGWRKRTGSSRKVSCALTFHDAKKRGSLHLRLPQEGARPLLHHSGRSCRNWHPDSDPGSFTAHWLLVLQKTKWIQNLDGQKSSSWNTKYFNRERSTRAAWSSGQQPVLSREKL